MSTCPTRCLALRTSYVNLAIEISALSDTYWKMRNNLTVFKPDSPRVLQDVHKALRAFHEKQLFYYRIAIEVDASASAEQAIYYDTHVAATTTKFINDWVHIFARQIRTNIAAKVIQKAWLHAYYTPSHPTCKARLTREFCYLSKQMI